MFVMTEHRTNRLNQLLRRLPAGFIADSAWLQKQGLSRSSIHDYVAQGWLERVTPRVYRRPLPTADSRLRWDIAVLSLQRLMNLPLHVGGRTALELAGYAHYLETDGSTTVHLYGKNAPPWLERLPATARFVTHSTRLFTDPKTGVEDRRYDLRSGQTNAPTTDPDSTAPWDWPLKVAFPERAILEMIDELPRHETFHQVDVILQGLTNLRPNLLTKLLHECTSVKVKRLFLWYANRHQHQWLKHLDTSSLNLGTGKRQLVPGGRLDPHYNITLPEDMFEDETPPHAL
jgi:hypothetical protein